MLDVENIIEQYKAKGGTNERIVCEILTSSSEERKNWLISIISQYNDLSKLSFPTLLDIKHDKNINMKILDKYVRACLEDRDDRMVIFDEYLESKHKTPTSKPQKTKETSKSKTKTDPNVITCKMYPGSTDVETTDLVNGLYSAAKEWYGIEYDQRLRDTIDGTLFYECGLNESCIDIEERFLGRKYSEEEKRKLAGVFGITLKLDKGNGDYQPIIIYKKTPYFDYAATLAHELFYHQFCRQTNFEVENDDGKKFYRDGIALLSKERGLRKNEALNEGFADYNATGIMKIYTGNKEYKLDPRRLYAPLQKYAEQIASCYDKKQLIDAITTGTPTIEELTQAKEFDFNTFSEYLDMYLRTQEIQNIEIADMFFERFRAIHDLPQTQASIPRNPSSKMRGRNNSQITYGSSNYGTTGIRPKKDFGLSNPELKSMVIKPNPENIDYLESISRRIEELMQSLKKEAWRDTDD